MADVVDWLSKNQTMFKEEIFMPPWISVFVKDPKYQAMVESELPFSPPTCLFEFLNSLRLIQPYELENVCLPK